MSWQALLHGSLKDRALAAIQAILDDLAAPASQGADDPSLADGLAGQALLHGYLAVTGRDRQHGKGAREYLSRAIALVADKPTAASLYAGLAGVGWALAHLQSLLPDLRDAEQDAADIDEALLNHLRPSPSQADYDLIGGLVGFGVYALERLPRPAAAACLERIVHHLGETAQLKGAGISWWTNPDWLPAETREKYPGGYYNLGLAHGVPGVIGLLGSVCARRLEAVKAGAFLEGAVRWLLAHDGSQGLPYWTEAGSTEDKSRLAWCYGDPGVAASLLWAAKLLRNPHWESRARAIARRAAQRSFEDSGVKDVGLCHGAAGLGHLFNRMFQATADPLLAQAARRWFERALDMRQPGQGIGGYLTWSPGGNGKPSWLPETGFLTGAAGIALALLAATTEIEPAWDRVLMTAIPPITPQTEPMEQSQP
jgi:lantibiotic biosynthesis protein